MNGLQYRVVSPGLHLRSSPEVRGDNKLVVLNQGQVVSKVAASENERWWKVRATLNGRSVEGFAAHSSRDGKLLLPVEASPQPPKLSRFEVHLPENNPDITRDRDGGRAHPLGERGRPRLDKTSPGAAARSLRAAVDWLDVERMARYLPRGGETFCNIYAYDYCYLAGAYLPRVWWKGPALEGLANGREAYVLYGKTVGELNANGLYGWLEDYGPHFGWERVFGPGELQEAANGGAAAVVCAQNRNLNGPGHISVVVPEAEGQRAVREGTDVVPLQSQAGARNVRYGTEGGRWWQHPRFGRFGFWKHTEGSGG